MDISFDEIRQILADTAAGQQAHALQMQVQAAQIVELEKKFAAERSEREEKMAAERSEREEKMAAEKAEREEKMAAEKAEREKKFAAEKAEREDKMAAERSEREKTMAKSKADMERTIKQTNKQLGELGNKLGSFAEGLAYPTVERIMLEQLGMTHVGPIKISKGGETLQVDALGYANGASNTVTVGEIKSHFRDEHVEQIEKICAQIQDFIPDHHGKVINGMAIFVQGDPSAINLAIKRGLYVVQANDENFKLLTPKKFVARDFGKL